MESSKYHILQYECVSVHRVYHTFFQETQTRNIKLHKNIFKQIRVLYGTCRLGYVLGIIQIREV